MPVPEPVFDSRTYRQILEEAVARIPAHNPEWTNFNDSDPGVTLLQLFAFMTENIIYRANLIPERNRRKFLRLVGQPLRAAEPANGIVTFENASRLPEVITRSRDDLSVAAGNITFEMENGLDVLPLNARLYYKSPLAEARVAEIDALYQQLYASQLQQGEVAQYYESQVYAPPSSGMTMDSIDLADTVDGSLWVALLAPPTADPEEVRVAIAGKTLTLGILPALDAEGKTLYPRGSRPSVEDPSLVFEMPNTDRDDAGYRRLTPRTDVDLLSTPGVVELPLPTEGLDFWRDLDPLEAGVGDFPPSLEDTPFLERLVTWLRLRSPEAFEGRSDPSRQVRAPLSWVGVNAALAVQRARVVAEQLPGGNGEPDQHAVLANTPVMVDTVGITVNGEPWDRIDDLAAADPEVPPRSPRLTIGVADSEAQEAPTTDVYTADRESGEVQFGNGLHGRRPPPGASIQASYAYGGGARGNIGIGAIAATLANGLKARNPVPFWGGSDGELLPEAERRIPSFLRHSDRPVSELDLLEVTKSTPGVDLGRVEILPLVHPDDPAQDSAGVVTILVIPRNDPLQPEAPRPDRLFLEALCRYLEPRRVLTTELHIIGPTYVPVWVSVGINIVPGRAEGPVRDLVRAAVQQFVSPLVGGFVPPGETEGTGWPLERPVDVPELMAAVARVSGVAAVNGLLLGDATGEVASVPIQGLQLPRLLAVEVVSGDPPSIEEIQGRAPERDGPVLRPLPVIPPEC